METVRHNIGAQLKLPVDRVVAIKGRKTYIVKYGQRFCRVPMFDWQEEQPIAKEILCRLVSINEFGFPSFEQVAQKKEVSLIDPVSPKGKKRADKNQSKSFFEKYGSFLKRKPSDTMDSNKKTIVNITNFLWNSKILNFEKWFIETGGIKKRLGILISLAEQLADYHRQNKVYKELVPKYIDIESTEQVVKAILPKTNYFVSGFDNIFINADYAAPEVVNRRMPNTPMSDCYSFAILAHEILDFCHPFIGDVVIEGKYSMDKAMRGNLPWIDDSNDPLNKFTRRKYDNFFTTPEIRNLFMQTFEEGKDDPIRRPSMYQWVDALNDAKSHLKNCPHCSTDYIYSTKDDCCPFCEEEQAFPIAVAIQHIDKKFNKVTYTFSETEKELYPDIEDVLLVNKLNKLYINSRHLMTDTMTVKNVMSIKVISSDGEKNVSVILEPLNGYSFYASTVKGERYKHPINKPTKIMFPSVNQRKLILSLKPIDEVQRVLNIQLNNDAIYAEN